MKIAAFGEVMLRFTPPEYLMLEQTEQLRMNFVGTGVNLLANLAHFQLETALITKLPANRLGEAVKAAEAMSADINDVMHGLAADMSTALPTSFSVDGSVTDNGVKGVSAAAGQTVINIYPQTLDEATIDYLFVRFNARLGAAI